MVITGNGESVFDTGEGALETATTSKEAAGAQITHSQNEEVVNLNSDDELLWGSSIEMSTI